MEQALASLEASALAQTIRRSVWLYPSANVFHILGLMVFFAAVAAMDVKAIYAKSEAELRSFIKSIRPVAVLALLVQVGTGILLFLPEATHIAHNRAFQIKLALLVVAFLNLLLFESAVGKTHETPAQTAKVIAVGSIALWISVAAAGRLIAYI
jgi:hypothetical protein